MKTFYTGDTIPINATLLANAVPVDLTGAFIYAAVLDVNKAVLWGPAAIGIDGDPTLGKIAGYLPTSPVTPSQTSNSRAAQPTQAGITAYIEIESVIAGNRTTYGQEQVLFLISPDLS
jgi:hypothetical protein